MKKWLLISGILSFFVSCSSNDEDYNPLQERLIGEWIQYGEYWITKGGVNNPDDTSFYKYEKPYVWTFDYHNINVNDYTISNTNYEYWIKNDSLYFRIYSKDEPSRGYISFAGDSCMLTSAWGGTYNTKKNIYVLHPKN